MTLDELKEYAKSLFAQLPDDAILEILEEVEVWKCQRNSTRSNCSEYNVTR